MKQRLFFSVLWLACSIGAFAQTVLLKKIERYTAGVSKEYGLISSERKAELNTLADRVVAEKMKGEKPSIVFISFSNSSSSQMAQAWMQVAIERYNLKDMQVYSSGTTEAEIDKAIISAMRNAGFKIEAINSFVKNPKYLVAYSWDVNGILMFSKKSDNYQIPTSGIINVNIDDQNASVINYNETSRKIAREMFFMAEKIQNSHLLSHQQ